MDDIYKAAILREKVNTSKYLNDVKSFKGMADTQEQIEHDLLDMIVFCKWCIERLRRI